ncbi:secreted RxLR effector protein 161-like [Pistacia vera]|uniref:secreted RxLR effector protein 161-like n=1 Tax=Pistacia vera TaxID=55513 RepID=UPI001263247D|nr:secreted RxLR effector protein 161-like [Pistacia vera]
MSKFGMADSKLVSMPLANHVVLNKSQCPKTESDLIKMESVPYAYVVGSMMYGMISTRLDLSYSISLLSRFMANPSSDHWTALKRVLRYINGTLNVGLNFYKRHNTLDLVGFVDSDFAGDKDIRKSTTSYYFTLGGNCISWKSQLQPIVALLSTEAEYIAIVDVFKAAVWLQGLLAEAKLTDGKSRSLVLRAKTKAIVQFSLERSLEKSLHRASRQQNKLNPAFERVAVFEEIIKGVKEVIFNME